MILTSGTTGTPKGANRASPSSLGPAAALLSRIPLARPGADDDRGAAVSLLGLCPPVPRARRCPRRSCCSARFDPQGTLQAVAEHRATALIVVPVMLQRILELDPSERRGDRHLLAARDRRERLRASGPAGQRVMDAFGEKLYNLYGSTEVAWATIADARGPASRAGYGRPTAARHRRQDPRRRLARAARRSSGRIFVGNEMLFEGYTGGGDKAARSAR